MEGGRITAELPSLHQIRAGLRPRFDSFDPTYLRLLNPHGYKVSISAKLKELKLGFIKKYMLYRFSDLPRSVATGPSEACAVEASSRPLNPKRALREARRDAARPSSTKAQSALAEAHEAAKAGAKASCREARSEIEALRFAERAEQRKGKHRGH